MSCMRESGVPADGAAPKNSPADVAGALTYAKTTLERERESHFHVKWSFQIKLVFSGGGRAAQKKTNKI